MLPRSGSHGRPPCSQQTKHGGKVQGAQDALRATRHGGASLQAQGWASPVAEGTTTCLRLRPWPSARGPAGPRPAAGRCPRWTAVGGGERQAAGVGHGHVARGCRVVEGKALARRQARRRRRRGADGMRSNGSGTAAQRVHERASARLPQLDAGAQCSSATAQRIRQRHGKHSARLTSHILMPAASRAASMRCRASCGTRRSEGTGAGCWVCRVQLGAQAGAGTARRCAPLLAPLLSSRGTTPRHPPIPARPPTCVAGQAPSLDARMAPEYDRPAREAAPL